jgi:hypothetical protein
MVECQREKQCIPQSQEEEKGQYNHVCNCNEVGIGRVSGNKGNGFEDTDRKGFDTVW